MNSNILTGIPISELPWFDKETLSNSIFIVSKCNHPYSESLGSTNYYVTFEQFAEKIVKDVKNGYGSMISEDKDNYSKERHTHSQYNKLSVNMPNNNGNTLAVFKFKTGEGNIQLKDIPVEYELPEYPYIGQLKFIASNKDYSKVELSAKDFDGWVQANGKQYVIDGFNEAKSYFPSDETSFVVPNLTSFVRCTGKQFEYNVNEFGMKAFPSSVSGTIVEGPHYHETDLKTRIGQVLSVEVGVAPTSTSIKQENQYVQACGSVNEGIDASVGTIELSSNRATIVNMETSYSDTSLECETFPDHFLFQVLIYVGVK